MPNYGGAPRTRLGELRFPLRLHKTVAKHLAKFVRATRHNYTRRHSKAWCSFILMAYLIFRRNWLKIPGQIIGVFFIGYGLARVIVEGYRQADLQFISIDNPNGHIIRLYDFGLTMGQTLSLPMVFIGIAVIYMARRRAT